jgi:hypothetical protein
MAAAGGSGRPSPEPEPEPKPVYTMFSHSFTVPLEPGKPMPKIPDGCILVTMVECGKEMIVASQSKELEFDRFRQLFNNPNNQEMLADPIENQKKIEKLIGMKINIHHPHAFLPQLRDYIDVEYRGAELTHINWPMVGQFTYHTSGLYRSGTVQSKIFRTVAVNSKFNAQKIIESMYEPTVLYPKRGDIISKMEEILHEYPELKQSVDLIKKVGNNFTIKQSDLFTMFPGVYYVTTCRSALTDSEQETTKRMGRGSREAIARVVMNYDKMPWNHKKGEAFYGFPDQMYRLPSGTTYLDYIRLLPKGIAARTVVERGADDRQVIELVSVENNIEADGGDGGDGGGNGNGAGGGGAGPQKMTKEQIAKLKEELIASIMSLGYEGDIKSMSIDELENLLRTLERDNHSSVGSAPDANYEYNNNNNNQNGGRRRLRISRRTNRRRLHTRRRRRTLRR